MASTVGAVEDEDGGGMEDAFFAVTSTRGIFVDLSPSSAVDGAVFFPFFVAAADVDDDDGATFFLLLAAVAEDCLFATTFFTTTGAAVVTLDLPSAVLDVRAMVALVAW
jgi:hypothetical protein